MIDSIFSPYKFALQQFITNGQTLQGELDDGKEKKKKKIKLLGLQ